MNLIEIKKQTIDGGAVDTVSARELHSFLEVGKDFSTWIKDRIDQYGFVERQDFVVFDSPIPGNQTGRGGDRRSKEYALTLDMAKELAMVERNEKGKQARQYFIECERRAKQLPAPRASADPALSSLRTAKSLELAVSSAERLIALLPLLGDQAKQGIVASCVNRVAGTEMVPLPELGGKTYTAGDIAKILNVSANQIGRVANAHGLKTEEYGLYVLDKSRSTDKQVQSFRYNEAGLARLRALIAVPLRALPKSDSGQLFEHGAGG